MTTIESAEVPVNEEEVEEPEEASLDDLVAHAIDNADELASELEGKKKNEGSETIYIMERQFEMKQGKVVTNSKGKRCYQEGDCFALDESLQRLTVDGEVYNEKHSTEMCARKGPEKKKQKESKKAKKTEKKQDEENEE